MVEFNEKRSERSTTWKVVMGITTAIIVGVILYFAIAIFTQIPLVGAWSQVETEYSLDIKEEGTLLAEGNLGMEGVLVEIPFDYAVDTTEKTVELSYTSETIEQAVEQVATDMNEQQMRQIVSAYATIYGYSIEQDVLTLTNIDSGQVYKYKK